MLLAVAAAALCHSAQITAKLTSAGRGAGQVYDTIVVRNVSASPCALGPAPAVMLVDSKQRNGRELQSARTASPAVTLPPRAAASFVLHWTPMGTGGSPCAQPAQDVWLYAGGGLPLWVPIGLRACYPVEVRPYVLGTGAPGPPAPVPNRDAWQSAYLCSEAFAQTEDGRVKPDRPAGIDALKLPVKYVPISGNASRPDVMAPSIWTDAVHGIMTNEYEDFGEWDALACSRIVSIPPIGRRASLANVSTGKGVRLGMTPQQVQRLEGRAHLHVTRRDTQTLFYRWTSGTGDARRIRTLTFAFWKNALFGIHYQDTPEHRAP